MQDDLSSNKRTYFSHPIRLNELELFLLWYSEDYFDGFCLDSDNRLAAFRSKADLADFARQKGIKLSDAQSEGVDLDEVIDWIEKPRTLSLDCNKILNAWNFGDDVRQSIRGHSACLSKQAFRVYEKLFWGCNLPAVTPESCEYIPIWRGREIYLIKRMIKSGIDLATDKLQIYD